MSGNQSLCALMVLGATAVLFACMTPVSSSKQDDLPLVVDELFYVKPGISPKQLFEARGYKAREYSYTTPDGFIMRLTRGTNPLVNNGEKGADDKLPMFFLHGTAVPATVYMLNSAGIRPKLFDTKGLNLPDMTQEQLTELVGDDPSNKSLPFLALNFGYEVWLLDRRGYKGSDRKVGHEKRSLGDALKALPTTFLGNFADAGFKIDENDPSDVKEAAVSVQLDNWDNALEPSEPSEPKSKGSLLHSLMPKKLNLLQALITFTKLMKRDWSSTNKLQLFVQSFDPAYWAFSADEQVEYDFPLAVDFVLRETGKQKVHLVGYSSGAGIPLLALANTPELADKIFNAVLWAPAAKLGDDTLLAKGKALFSLLKGYSGPLPPNFIMPELEAFESLLCSTEKAQSGICATLVDLIVGKSNGQAPMRLFFVTCLWRPVSIIEWTHFSQFTGPGDLCKYRFNTDEENIKKYGQASPPCYDLSQVKLQNIKFYVGGTDFLVSPGSVQDTISRLGVPAELVVINGTDSSGTEIAFNHIGFFLHPKAPELAILPSMLDFLRLETAAAKVASE